jgi:hypothetical protein
MMPLIELLTADSLLKYAPILFLTVRNGKVAINWSQLTHTLIVAAVVAGVTMYGTARVMDVRLDTLERHIEKMDTLLTAVALRQAAVVSEANKIHELQNERIRDLEQQRRK